MADRGSISDIAFAAALFILIFGGLYAYSGGWPPLVSVTSESMVPHLEKGDLVFIQSLSRGDVMTNEDSNHTSFGMAGDVIVYRPDGSTSATPIIHRAIRHVEQGEPIWNNGPEAPWAGYVTRGDNNGGVYDQMTNISYLAPVKKEWVIGIARFRVPYVGYVRSLLPL